tara:strand:- start:403 stop:1116 length:714 start_codon:yes stop_codon:yes gene_type:complete
MAFYDFILESLFLFQQESVILLFAGISLWILILLGIDTGLTELLVKIIGGPQKKLYQLIIYPFLIVGSYFATIYFVLPFMDLDPQNLGILLIFDTIIKYWYFFIIFPAFSALMKLPFKFILKDNEYFQKALLPGIFEEISYRFFLINSVFLVTKSMEMSIFISIIVFSLGHTFQGRLKNWTGLLAMNYTLIGGIIFAIIAIQYGLIFSILGHIAHNVIATLLGQLEEEQETKIIQKS